jgi:hypothetical protein
VESVCDCGRAVVAAAKKKNVPDTTVRAIRMSVRFMEIISVPVIDIDGIRGTRKPRGKSGSAKRACVREGGGKRMERGLRNVGEDPLLF